MTIWQSPDVNLQNCDTGSKPKLCRGKAGLTDVGVPQYDSGTSPGSELTILVTSSTVKMNSEWRRHKTCACLGH